MKIKTRLLLYNIIIIFTSAVLLLGALWYIQESSHQAMQEIETVTTEDGTVYYIPQKHQTPNNSADENTSDPKLPFRDDLNFDPKNSPHDDLPEPFRRPYWTMIIATAIVLIIVILLSFLLSHRILKRVMRPVKLLEQAAARVRSGDYSTEITYSLNDEFTPVIAAFNAMQAELLAKNQKALAYETAKRKMVNGISHDLRTPLTVVKGNIKGIQDGIADTAKKRQQYLATAYARTLDIENLTNKLFETFNYETADLQLHLQPTDLVEFIQQAITENEYILSGQAKAKLSLPNQPLTFSIDRTEFKRVFDNLINNAIKYSGQKIPLLKISLTSLNSSIQITFSDNGKGVKASSLPFIFDEFYKEDSSRNQDKSSSGLDLFIVKRIITSHGGTITAKNARGLKFTITLKEVTHA